MAQKDEQPVRAWTVSLRRLPFFCMNKLKSPYRNRQRLKTSRKRSMKVWIETDDFSMLSITGVFFRQIAGFACFIVAAKTS